MLEQVYGIGWRVRKTFAVVINEGYTAQTQNSPQLLSWVCVVRVIPQTDRQRGGEGRETEGETGRQRQTGRQTDRQTDRHTDRQTRRQAHRQTDRKGGVVSMHPPFIPLAFVPSCNQVPVPAEAFVPREVLGSVLKYIAGISHPFITGGEFETSPARSDGGGGLTLLLWKR